MSVVWRKLLIGMVSVFALFASDRALAAPTGPLLRDLGPAIPVISAVRVGGLPGASGYGIADFDGDGMDDIALGGEVGDWNSGTSVIKVYGTREGDFGSKQAVILGTDMLSQVLAWTEDGVPKLLTIMSDGEATVWTDWPLREVRMFNVGTAINAAAIGDVDVDGQLDLIAANESMLTAYNLATGVPSWSTANGGEDIVLTQLDADLPVEIVIANRPGVVIDGATQAIDYSYIDGFGSYVAAGPIIAGELAGFVAAHDSDHFTVFQSDPWLPLWSADVSDISAIAVADLDGDGQAEIIEGDGQWGSVNIYDTVTHTVRTTIAHPGYDVLEMATVDPFGEGLPQLAFSAPYVSEGYTPIFLANPATGTIISDLPALRSGPYNAVAIGDLDGDGVVELAHGAGGDSYYGFTGTLTVTAVPSGTVEWQSPFVDGELRVLSEIIPAALCQVGNLLVVAGFHGNGQLLAIDTQTHSIAWRVGSYNGGPMDNTFITDAALWDWNGDTVKDVVVSTMGVKLLVFSGVDGSLFWQSPAIGESDYTPSHGVFVGDTGYGTGPEVVAVLPHSLHAYNVGTQLLDWVLPVDADGASLIPSGLAGIELGVFLGHTLSFYSGTSHGLLRSISMAHDIAAVRQLGDIHHLLIAAGGYLAIVDGTDGTVLVQSTYLGPALGAYNQLAVMETSPGSWLIGAGSAVGVFSYRYDSSERIFADGFDALP